MTTFLRFQPAFVFVAFSFTVGVGCNSLTGIGDLSIGAGGAGGAGVGPAVTTGGETTVTSGGAGGSPVPGTTAASTSAGSTSAGSTSAATTGGGGVDAAQLCVDGINAFRATLGLAPYARWTPEEACAADEASKDAAANKAHSAFGQCSEWAQDECPGWPGPPEGMIQNCLQMMWNEGPGDFNAGHGHYINMSSTSYTKVACGFHVLPGGSVWATQDFQ